MKNKTESDNDKALFPSRCLFHCMLWLPFFNSSPPCWCTMRVPVILIPIRWGVPKEWQYDKPLFQMTTAIIRGMMVWVIVMSVYHRPRIFLSLFKYWVAYYEIVYLKQADYGDNITGLSYRIGRSRIAFHSLPHTTDCIYSVACSIHLYYCDPWNHTLPELAVFPSSHHIFIGCICLLHPCLYGLPMNNRVYILYVKNSVWVL